MITEDDPTKGDSPDRFHVFRGRLTRSTHDRIVAGLAGGIAARLGVPTVFVRAAFVSLTLAGGFGIICYLAGWLTVPDDQQYGSMITADRPPTTAQKAGLSLGFVALLFVLDGVGLWFGSIVWPATLFVFGSALVWDRSSAESRDRMSRFAKPSVDRGSHSRTQIIVGVGLMAVGIVVVLTSLDSFQALGPVAVAVLITAAGFMLLFGPWMLGLIEDLTKERRARIRSEERADMAAHLHDSVLQTLALIQRNDDPQRMTTLARAQERDLRAWLFEPTSNTNGGTIGEAISAAAAKTESDFDVPIEVVVVGDRSLDDGTEPLVAAAGEAMANSAEHSGARSVSVYVECSQDGVEAWVTDQGSGFEIDEIADQRKGLSESIVARMARSGGEAIVVSRPGEGTEIHLRSESA
jgi:signal transduction histidine kinase/phage shock protein PspC (stress-responsive transcriptional regulator)